MKKILVILGIGILAMMFTACLDTGSTSPSAPSYEYVAPSSSSVRSVPSSSVRSVPSSSSVATVVLDYTHTPNVQRPQSSSSASKDVTLGEVCDEAAIALMSEGTYSTLSSACSDYRGFLSYLGLTGSEINACMELEGCSQASTGTQTAVHHDSVYVSQCNKSFECTKGDCRSCMDKITSQSAGMGVGRGSGTCSKIKKECFGVYY